MRDPTRDFYATNAAKYASATITHNLGALWNAFGALVPRGSLVLDFGCGSGRDLRELHRRGFRVIGVDYSPPLATMARSHSGQEVVLMDFRASPLTASTFDGIWAVASLLHVPRAQVLSVLGALNACLRAYGILLSSMQKGHGSETAADGRHF